MCITGLVFRLLCLPQPGGFSDRHNDTCVTQSNKALCCHIIQQIAVSIITFFFPFGDGEAIEVAAMERYLFLFLQIAGHAGEIFILYREESTESPFVPMEISTTCDVLAKLHSPQ